MSIKANKRTLIRWKIYIDRARMYIGYINFFMIGILFLKNYKETSWGAYFFEHYYFTFPLLIVAFFILSLLIGFIDTKLGLRQEELRNAAASNPVTQKILKNIEEINEKLEKINPPDKKVD